MKYLFVDTAGWIAAADSADPAHQKVCCARDQWLRDEGMLMTTDYVMDETLTTLRMRLGLKSAQLWWQQIDGSSRLRIEWMNVMRTETARRIFFTQRDKQYSFTDCTSFAVMQELKISSVLTLDQHFRKAGFIIIPS